MRLLSHFQTAGEGIGNYTARELILVSLRIRIPVFSCAWFRGALFRRGTDFPLWPFSDCWMAKETTVVFFCFFFFFSFCVLRMEIDLSIKCRGNRRKKLCADK